MRFILVLFCIVSALRLWAAGQEERVHEYDPKYKKLYMKNCLDSEVAAALQQHALELNRLSLSPMLPLTEDWVRTYLTPEQLPALNYLRLGPITDQAVNALKPFRLHVTYLSLADEHLTNRVLKTVAEFKSLKDLYLWSNGITDEGIISVLESCPFLETVSLSGRHITQKIFQALLNLPKPHHIDLESCHSITSEDLEALKDQYKKNGRDNVYVPTRAGEEPGWIEYRRFVPWG